MHSAILPWALPTPLPLNTPTIHTTDEDSAEQASQRMKSYHAIREEPNTCLLHTKPTLFLLP